MKQIKFMLDSENVRVKLDLTPAEVKDFFGGKGNRSINVGFDSDDLGEGLIDQTWWVVSDTPLPSTKRFEVRRFTLIGRAGWLNPEGKRYQGFSIQNEHLHVEVCTEWLEKLFGTVPQDLWFRRRTKPRA